MATTVDRPTTPTKTEAPRQVEPQEAQEPAVAEQQQKAVDPESTRRPATSDVQSAARERADQIGKDIKAQLFIPFENQEQFDSINLNDLVEERNTAIQGQAKDEAVTARSAYRDALATAREDGTIDDTERADLGSLKREAQVATGAYKYLLDEGAQVADIADAAEGLKQDILSKTPEGTSEAYVNAATSPEEKAARQAKVDLVNLAASIVGDGVYSDDDELAINDASDNIAQLEAAAGPELEDDDDLDVDEEEPVGEFEELEPEVQEEAPLT
jgi:hypothetical protein